MTDIDNDDNSTIVSLDISTCQLSTNNINIHNQYSENTNCNVYEQKTSEEENNSINNLSDISSNRNIENCSVSDKFIIIDNGGDNFCDIISTGNKKGNIYVSKYYNTIDLGFLINTTEDISDDLFEDLNVEPITMLFDKFMSIFYISKNLQPSFCFFDHLYKKLNFSLINEFLTILEIKMNTTREKIRPDIKINLFRELSFDLLSYKMRKTIVLRKRELMALINSSINNSDDKINVAVTYKIFSNILKFGVNLKFKILLVDVKNVNSNVCLSSTIKIF